MLLNDMKMEMIVIFPSFIQLLVIAEEEKFVNIFFCFFIVRLNYNKVKSQAHGSVIHSGSWE